MFRTRLVPGESPDVGTTFLRPSVRPNSEHASEIRTDPVAPRSRAAWHKACFGFAPMVAVVHGATLLGVDARRVEVEIELAQGLPFFAIIGLGDAAVQEARFRIQAAIRAAELDLPHKRVTVNLAPASVRKDGAALDLPMALGLLMAAGHLPAAALEGAVAVGELALSGLLRPVRGVLSVAALAKELGARRLIVPRGNGAEAACVEGLEVVAVEALGPLVHVLRGARPIPPVDAPSASPPAEPLLDLAEVRGQRGPRRALEIAAAGAHNLLLIGNPGGGKTMLARRLPGILPPPTPEERIEITKVWSAAGLTLSGGLTTDRPFRAPHHTISEAALVGGGSTVRPGEVSLAHRGVLFLDEMPEFPRRVLETLRQPLEDREVVIARARQVVKLPAHFMLVGAANPCPCGWLGHSSSRCMCSEDEVARYSSRLSGALLDRIDLVVEAPTLSVGELLGEEVGESSDAVRSRVIAAREGAMARRGAVGLRLSAEALKRGLDAATKQLLVDSLERLRLSARAVDRSLRVARTIADLEGSQRIRPPHLAEALQFRRPTSWAEVAR